MSKEKAESELRDAFPYKDGDMVEWTSIKPYLIDLREKVIKAESRLIAAEEEIAAKNRLLLNISTYAVKTSVLSNEEIYDARKDAERVVKDAEMCIKSKGA